MAQQLGVKRILSGQNFVPSTYIRRLTAARNSGSKGSNALFEPLWGPVHRSTYRHII